MRNEIKGVRVARGREIYSKRLKQETQHNTYTSLPCKRHICTYNYTYSASIIIHIIVKNARNIYIKTMVNIGTFSKTERKTRETYIYKQQIRRKTNRLVTVSTAGQTH